MKRFITTQDGTTMFRLSAIAAFLVEYPKMGSTLHVRLVGATDPSDIYQIGHWIERETATNVLKWVTAWADAPKNIVGGNRYQIPEDEPAALVAQ